MGVIAVPNTFSPNTSISSSQVNSNFSTIYNEFNGSIAAANLATGAVTTAKIADSNVTTAKIADSNVTTAKIADGAVTPVKRSGGYKVGTFTWTSGTGNLSITGVGFTPKMVEFYVLRPSTNSLLQAGGGVMDTSSQHSWTVQGGNGTNAYRTGSSATNCIVYASGAITLHTCSYVSMNSDGFTIVKDTNNTDAPTVGYRAYA